MRKAIVHIVAVLGIGVLVCGAQAGAVWLDVPFVKQEKNGCGAASIAMVMQYWQRQQSSGQATAADAAEIQKALYRAEARGIYASELETYLRQHGYKTFAFPGQMNHLAGQLAKGRPLIAGLETRRGAPLHYIVIAGVDTEKRVVLLNDPAERKLLQRDFDTFEKEWRGTDHWTLLAVPSSGDDRTTP
jgi:ABC-type bacteriocin/lantibiotic exporter with double-glycine peptidase domain